MRKMSVSNRIISPQEIGDAYREILKSPLFVEELSDYECEKVLAYAQLREEEGLNQISYMISMETNSLYPYPEEYLPNRLIEYWIKNSSYVRDPRKVIHAIKNYKIPESFFPEKKSTNKGKSISTFASYLKHPNKDAFADLLKKEYENSKAREYRSMIEGLLHNNFIKYDGINCEPLYQSMRVHFGDNIPTKAGIFNKKWDNMTYKGLIEKASKAILELYYLAEPTTNK
jgi:hypothetical protein